MALNYDLKNIADWKTKCFETVGEESRMNGILDAMIWATIITGKSDLKSDSDVREFYLRWKLYSKFFGSIIYRDGKEYFPTFEEVAQFKGLQTNGGWWTRAEFLKDVTRRTKLLLEEMERYFDKEHKSK